MPMVLDFGFVTAYLTVQFVGQLIDGSIQIGMRTFSKQIAALYMQIALGSLAFFLFLHVVHGQKNSYIHYLIKMPGNTVELARHVAA